MIGNFVQAVVRNPGDDDARFGGRRNVDIIHADAEASDDPAACQVLNHFGGHFRVGGEHRVGIARHFQNGVGLGFLGEAHFRADLRQHFASRIEIGEH